VMIALSSLKGSYSAGRVVDIAVIGTGIGGLSCAAILNSLYGMQTEVFESGFGLV
jgi:predicted NAD/FAD-dependent oxidoreductase